MILKSLLYTWNIRVQWHFPFLAICCHCFSFSIESKNLWTSIFSIYGNIIPFLFLGSSLKSFFFNSCFNLLILASNTMGDTPTIDDQVCFCLSRFALFIFLFRYLSILLLMFGTFTIPFIASTSRIWRIWLFSTCNNSFGVSPSSWAKPPYYATSSNVTRINVSSLSIIHCNTSILMLFKLKLSHWN